MPEMKGRSIESMDDLFSYSIWTMYKRAYPTEVEKVRHDVGELFHDNIKAAGLEEKRDGDIHVERV